MRTKSSQNTEEEGIQADVWREAGEHITKKDTANSWWGTSVLFRIFLLRLSYLGVRVWWPSCTVKSGDVHAHFIRAESAVHVRLSKEKNDVTEWSLCCLWCFRNTSESPRRQTCISNQQRGWKNCKKFLKSCQIAMMFDESQADLTAKEACIIPLRRLNSSRKTIRLYDLCLNLHPLLFWRGFEKKKKKFWPHLHPLSCCLTHQGSAGKG